ncbi:MAG: ATP-binding protein [Ruminiclostridium sp.]
MNKLIVPAKLEELEKVIDFVDAFLEQENCYMRIQTQIDVAVEEIFVNIANYAYNPEIGKAEIEVEISDEPITVSITFKDSGVPYNPLEKADPDITLSAEERDIGGLGIFMVKKSMDDIEYSYKDGRNVLTIKKKL